MPHYNVMALAKASLESAVRYLAFELGPKNIRVNAISAGPIKTLAARGVGALGDMLKPTLSEHHSTVMWISSKSAAQRFIWPATSSSAVTGEMIYVDCGYNIMGF